MYIKDCIFSIEPRGVIFINNLTELSLNLSNFPPGYENSISNT